MEKAPIVVDPDDLENAVFGVAQEIADGTPGLSVRDKMRLTLGISDQIMLAVHSITETGKRSAAGKKAAETRYGKKPTPGPAVPAPAFQATRDSLAAAKVDTHENAQHMGKIDPVPQTVVVPPAIPAPPAPTAAPIPAVVTRRKPQPTPQAAPGAPAPGNFLQQPDTGIEPPPHPALLPGTTPFGSAPQ